MRCLEESNDYHFVHLGTGLHSIEEEVMPLREWDSQEKFEALSDARWEAVIAQQESREAIDRELYQDEEDDE